MTGAEALRACVASTYLALGKNAPRAHVEEAEDVWICKSRLRHSIGNFAINFRGSCLPERAVAAAHSNPHFRIYFMEGDEPAGLPLLAERAGLRLRYDLAGLELARPLPSERIGIARATTSAQALQTAEFMTDTFFWQSPRRSRLQLAQIMCSCFPRHEFFSISDDDGFAAAGTLTLDGEVIGLYNLCVRHDLRSRGLGTLLTAELSRYAHERARRVVLLCGDELIPWYSRIGYEKVGSLLAFST